MVDRVCTAHRPCAAARPSGRGGGRALATCRALLRAEAALAVLEHELGLHEDGAAVAAVQHGLRQIRQEVCGLVAELAALAVSVVPDLDVRLRPDGQQVAKLEGGAHAAGLRIAGAVEVRAQVLRCTARSRGARAAMRCSGARICRGMRTPGAGGLKLVGACAFAGA